MRKNNSLTAFVFVKTDCGAGEAKAAARIARIPEVQEVHRVAGEHCYLVKVRVMSAEALSRLLRDQFDTIISVCSTETTIVLKTVKESARLPLKSLAARAQSLN